MVQVGSLELDGMEERWINGKFCLCWMCTDGALAFGHSVGKCK